MVASNLLHDVLALPTKDRIELYDRLRESLLNDPALEPISEEHKRILDERLVDLTDNPEDQSDWDEVEVRMEQLLRVRS